MISFFIILIIGLTIKFLWSVFKFTWEIGKFILIILASIAGIVALIIAGFMWLSIPILIISGIVFMVKCLIGKNSGV